MVQFAKETFQIYIYISRIENVMQKVTTS